LIWIEEQPGLPCGRSNHLYRTNSSGLRQIAGREDGHHLLTSRKLTRRGFLERFLERFPPAADVEYTPVPDEATLAGSSRLRPCHLVSDHLQFVDFLLLFFQQIDDLPALGGVGCPFEQPAIPLDVLLVKEACRIHRKLQALGANYRSEV
jgi:hypothetical protein